MSMADKIANAEAFGVGTYLEPGLYLVEVQRLKEQVGRFRSAGTTAFIAELLIVESSNPVRPAGVGVSWYQGENKLGYDGRIKKFFHALFPDLVAMSAKDPKRYPAEFRSIYEGCVGTENLAMGQRVRVQVTATTSQAGRAVNDHQWAPAAK